LKWKRKSPKETEKMGAFRLVLPTETKDPHLWTRDKRWALLSRLGGPGWETGTKEVSQPGQIPRSVVVVSNKI